MLTACQMTRENIWGICDNPDAFMYIAERPGPLPVVRPASTARAINIGMP